MDLFLRKMLQPFNTYPNNSNVHVWQGLKYSYCEAMTNEYTSERFYAVIFFLADAWKVGDHILVKNIK